MTRKYCGLKGHRALRFNVVVFGCGVSVSELGFYTSSCSLQGRILVLSSKFV